ncbi:hypothetical protein AXG93_1520s1490 [Marchantia polymorpha subsp. ruderalis]|uniref:Probable DNA helicase MCM9 n=1 Tax=Marchantia polymorpha subsp. ruderalis TaxID=1480154 RepID=A0A176VJ72_MARPO|nr:hypothetical protein AXG93_1520s1490 [Marchantia polymorpha subsp. ruderalis]
MGRNQNFQAEQDDSAFVMDEKDQLLCLHFLRTFYSVELEEILRAIDESMYYPLPIEASDFYNACPHLGYYLYHSPTKLFRTLDIVASEAQKVIYDGQKHKKNLSLKNVHVRVSVQGSALDCPELHPSISQIRVKDLGHLLTIHGTVIRSGAVKMLQGERTYRCTKCKHSFQVFSDLEMGNSFPLPSSCPSQRTDPCGGQKFVHVEDSEKCHDYQEIKVQESMQALGVGSVPRSIVVVLDDDLVDTVQAGDDIVVTGVLFAKWKPLVKDLRCDLVLMLRANFIRRTNKLTSTVNITEYDVEQFERFWDEYKNCPLKGRNEILQGICPQVYGLFTVKLAVALTLIGGVQHINDSGARVRGESHLLLVGDPGTGKSQFLKYAVKLSHRAVLTTGLGSTSAGLTVTAIKDGGEWMLEAGALVLADGGLCCIDEFDSIREADRATIHEAMEQQTISVAKAGLVRTLNTRSTVFGVTNPKGQYDPYQSLSVNTTLSAPLLSRFDIVLVLLDTKNPEWDNIVSNHILEEHTKSQQSKKERSSIWTLNMLRSYMLYVRTEFKPVLTHDAEKVIMSYYQLQRRSGHENAAHARLMFRNEVLRTDAIAAVICVESSMTQTAILQNVGNALHSSFAENPDDEYAKQEQIILAALKLDDMGEPRRPTSPPGSRGKGDYATTEDGPDSDARRLASAGGLSNARENDDSDAEDRVCQGSAALKRKHAAVDDNPLSPISERVVPQQPAVRNHSARKPPKHPKRVESDKGRLARLTQNVLAKLKSQPCPSAAPAPGEQSARNTSQQLTEDLILSSQYSLP